MSEEEYHEPLDSRTYAPQPPTSATPPTPTHYSEIPLPTAPDSPLLEDSHSPIIRRPILQSPPRMTTSNTITLHGVTITVNTAETALTTNALLSKYLRPKEQEARLKFLLMIQKLQQAPFRAITVSAKDPEKMNNTHSIAMLLNACKLKLRSYDLLDVFTIVLPVIGSFTVGPTYGQLQLKADGTPVSHDLFSEYLSLVPDQVANSSRWQRGFIDSKELIQENLNWSLAYFQNNVESKLYARVHAKMLAYDPRTHGGPLFLKLLLDQITTTSEANLKQLLLILETYKIKVSCPGEDISHVVDVFTSIFDNIFALNKGILPVNSVRHLLQVLQTTSVDDFNAAFGRMTSSLNYATITNSIDPSYNLAMSASGAEVLANDMKSVHFALNFANQLYTDHCQQGQWEAVLQRPPGEAAFTAVLNGGSPVVNPPPATLPEGWKCFNCGEAHHLRDCPLPRDAAKILKNRSNHPRGTKGTNNNKARFKWRFPEIGEHNKRVIDQLPHTWDPNSGRNGRWIPDVTVESGQPASGNIPQANLVTADVVEDVEGESNSEKKLRMHLAIVRLQAKIESL